MSDRWLDRFAFGPVAAVRPWLLAKSLYLLLALDVWHTLVGPSWRYGAAGFNVAHFALLDALPIPTREAYVGMLVVVGAMAVTAALLPRTPRALSIAIAVLYTWGWSCSMLDSYQHHYLLTVLLVAAAMFPRLTAIDLFGVASTAPAPVPARPGKKKPAAAPVRPQHAAFPHGLVARVRSLGWTLAVTFAGVVYSFTAVSKSEPDWISGDALRNITNGGASMPAVMSFAESAGIDVDTLFHAMGWQTIVIQIVCALGYLTASLRDGRSTLDERHTLDVCWRVLVGQRTQVTITAAVTVAIGLVVGVGFHRAAGLAIVLLVTVVGLVSFVPVRPRPLSILASLALVLALSFHLGAEYIGLQIGWFSYYMIVLAIVALAPAHWLAVIAAVLTAPWRAREPGLLERFPLVAPVLGLVAAGAAAFAGVEIDLPGAYTACIVVGLVALALGVAALLRPELRARLGRATLALALAMVACWASMTSGNERYDFYRFAGGDFRRRHEYANALEAYREANRYAPPGESREDRIHEMEEALRREGGP